MKLAEHVEQIRQLIEQSYSNRLGRMGISPTKALDKMSIPASYHDDRSRMEQILQSFQEETGTYEKAYTKLIEELTFTLFNRLAALKVMEAHTLQPEVLTRRSQHGDRSFAHLLWLENHPHSKFDENEGLVNFLEEQMQYLSKETFLFRTDHPYHLLPTPIELNQIITSINKIELDPNVEANIWKSDDILGWLYESFNNFKKKAHKESKAKTEYDKVSIQSQVYTPRWVVKFLLDNSLGKLYLEMHPDSKIKESYLIANAPKEIHRMAKPITEIKIIDPAVGSGNFLLYAFDLFYDLYLDQIENYGNPYGYSLDQIPELILSNNLHGIDLDDRAVQLAQLGLYIKAKRKDPATTIPSLNIVSSDFCLPPLEQVRHLFVNGHKLSAEEEKVVQNIWADLQQAYQFGSLLRLKEKLDIEIEKLYQSSAKNPLYTEISHESIEIFRSTFFSNLKKALYHQTEKQGITFLNTKTSDALSFLDILTQSYDIAVANPPYTDSSDFGPQLKSFIEDNYKKPFKFHSNLYSCFMKRCEELVNTEGKIALIHPLTFMYIKSFEDMRKYILDKMHIGILVNYGPDSTNLFDGAFASAPAIYVIEKTNSNQNAWFLSLNQYTRTPNEKNKKDFCLQALKDYVEHKPNKHNYSLDQSKLKIIDGWPFIYWISDSFREKFKGKSLKIIFPPKSGLATADNERFLRYKWEVFFSKCLKNSKDERWINYSKGGPYNKWFGNNWLVVDWFDNAKEMRKTKAAVFRNEDFYFKEGITYSASGSKGTSFRFLQKNSVFDVGGAGLFSIQQTISLNFILAFLNTKLSTYIINCFNPTVNTQVGDLERIPIILPFKDIEDKLSSLASQNISIKKHLCSFHLIETNFDQTPLTAYDANTLADRALAHLSYENGLLGLILVHEAIINEMVYEIYELSPEDREQVEEKMGKSVGGMPVSAEASDAFLSNVSIESEEVREYVHSLPSQEFDPSWIQKIKKEFETLYQSNNDLESFCIKHQINPINVWYWFKEANELPKGRAQEIALEFLADALRTILQEDDDGIIPLTGLPGEPRLIDRLEAHCHEIGFSSAQFLQLESLLGKTLQEYLEHHFFKDLSNHLNLFMYLPKTPFIWHLSSGPKHGLEVYFLIYKWSQDSVFKLKSKYLHLREESLQSRLIQLADETSAQSQAEKALIHEQLQELSTFQQKIDSLIADGYNPILDSGVGKNIAPLQKKGMLRYEVLNDKQLKTYLEADW